MTNSSYALTLISYQKGPDDIFSEFETFISENHIEISDKKVLSNGKAVDYFLSDEKDVGTIREGAKNLIKGKADLIVQPASTRKDKKLFVFDMDSTLIYQEVIELIAAYANIEDKVAEITERAMNGELDFKESLKERVLLLKGIDATTLWDDVKAQLKVTNGAKELCRALKSLGCTMAVCSGGFIPLASYIKDQLGLDYAYANNLGVDENFKLDGTTSGTVVDGNRKAELLLEIASKHNINPGQAVAVGDGANDLKMMSVAGFGIAWNAKAKVQKLAPCCLNTDSLADVMYILGYSDIETTKLIS